MRIFDKLKKADSNTKSIFGNIFGAFAVKGGALVISLFSTPAFMRYFDDQAVLGVWYTVLSVITWVLSFDLGIGNGLRNKLVPAIASGDMEKTRKYISSGYIMLGAVSLLVTIVGLLLSGFVSWNGVFNISQEVIRPAVLLKVVRCVFVGIMTQFFLRIITSILYALQKSAVNNLLSLCTSILQLSFVLLAPDRGSEANIIMLSYAYMFFSTLPLLVATVVVFSTRLKGCFPRFKYFENQLAKSVLTLGGIFFACQILYMLIANTNEFLISNYASPDDVVPYHIYYKLFSLVGMIFTISLSPVWSAITKAIAEGKYAWFKKLFKTLRFAAAAAVIFEFLLIPFLQLILNIWLAEKSFEVNYLYAVVFACYGSVFIYQSVLSTIVCGIGKMKLQFWFYLIGIVIKFGIIHFGSMLFQSWVIVVAANVIILLPYCIAQQISLNRYIKKLEINELQAFDSETDTAL